MDSAALGKSREDYLEAILVQTRRNGACRAVDIATELGFSRPSVSIALQKLEDEGLIVREDWKILLTDEGRTAAEKTLEKHQFFRNLLIRSGVSPETADSEACLIEHALSEESFLRLRDYVRENLMAGGRAGDGQEESRDSAS